MEKWYRENNYIVKNPNFIKNIKYILEDKSIIIKTCIIPIRNYKLYAISRVKNNYGPSGLWCANDEESQILHYKDIISEYIYYMTKYDINTIFIDYDRMITDRLYLFNKIKPILDEKI